MNADEIIKLAKVIEWFKDRPLVGRYNYEESTVRYVKVTIGDNDYYIHEDEEQNIQVSETTPIFTRSYY